jgi:hypothetical protein
MLLFLSALKLVTEIALMALMGQGLLYVIAGGKHASNFFYQTLVVLTKPFTALVRKLTPAKVADQHVPVVAFFVLLIMWVVVTLEKVRYCVSLNMVGCQ